MRRRLRRLLEPLPSVLVHPEDWAFPSASLWTDVLLARKLRSLHHGVVIGTRPALNLIAAELAPSGVLKVGQEWMNYRAHKPGLAAEIIRQYPKLDALAVLTHDDLRDYARLLGGRTRVARIPNVLSELDGGVSSLDRKIVVAAGRLTWQKGFDLLIRAFARVVEHHPDWQLRIYGDGPDLARLRRLVFRHELYNNVALMGKTSHLELELAKASIFALSSRYEGMPGVLLEAMSKRLAVVAFDGPTGAGDVITPERDGLLVPNGDIEAFASRLLELIADPDRRQRLADAALETSKRYGIEVIGPQVARFLADVREQSRSGARDP